MQGRTAIRRKLGLALVAGALLLGACAKDEGSSSSSGATTGGSEAAGTVIKAGWVNETDVQTKQGGTMRVTLPAAPFGLDPTVASLGVTTGGAPLAALYDTLLKWDVETGVYSGQLAESISHTPDFSTWTLKLRPNVKFSDGTPLDADAVEFSVKRMKNARGSAATYPDYVASYGKPDPLTVVFTMVEPLNNFDSLLAGELGYVVSPTAVQAKGDGFNTSPVGAGPFVLDRFDPAAELIVKRNPSYSLGTPPLDGIRFVWNPEQGAAVDKLVAGETDMIMLTSVPEEVRAIQAGYPATTQLVAGSGLAVNSSPDRTFPGDDPRVRRALSLAIDRNAVNQRVNNGEGIMGDFLFPPGNRLHTDQPFSTFDPDEARRLVQEVKAETGWDGSFQLLTPTPTDYALAYQALFNNVGFNAQIDQVASFLELVERTNLSSNFDVSIHVITTYETNVYQALSRSLSSGSRSNYSKFSSPQLDALFPKLRGAADNAATVDVLGQIGTVWLEQQPFVLTGVQPFSTITGKNVGGVDTTVNGLVLFDKAFVA